jgi:subtilase family serine protease
VIYPTKGLRHIGISTRPNDRITHLNQEKVLTPISSIPLIIALVIPPLALVGSSAYAQAVATDVPAGIQSSKDLGLPDPSTEINITVHLKLSDKAAFDQAVEALYDPVSPTFHKWMTNDDLKKYAPR